MEAKAISLNKLLLDPNNYRLQDSEGFTPYTEDRFALDRVQDATRKRLRTENLEPLKNSILSNGFLEIERIVVSPFQHEDGKFLVIEGNRRVAALLSIRDDHDAGLPVDSSLISVFEAVPCLVAEGGQESFFREAIMGIRHVGGIKEWGGYQRAKLVADLKDTHGLDAGAISDRIGLSAIEVNRRYRAYKALQQMQGNEDYSEYAAPALYPLFHEAVSVPAIRTWLEWNQEESRFDNYENTERFYELISPRSLDDGETRPPKLKTYSDIRMLREVLGNQEAVTSLLQPDREFVDALTIANQRRMVGRWRNEVTEARNALSNIPGLELSQLSPSDVALISQLIETATQVLNVRKVFD